MKTKQNIRENQKYLLQLDPFGEVEPLSVA